MSVYVDRIRDYGAEEVVKGYVGRKRTRARWSHLFADSEEECDAMAAQIGLRFTWGQHRGHPGRFHYDVVPSKRALAIKLGAIEVDDKRMVEIFHEQVNAAADAAIKLTNDRAR